MSQAIYGIPVGKVRAGYRFAHPGYADLDCCQFAGELLFRTASPARAASRPVSASTATSLRFA